MGNIEYLMDGKIAIFNDHKYVRDDKTGYYLCHDTPGTGTRLHRDIWEHYNGAIPDGYSIHHKDHDKSNNEIDNLQIMENSAHSKLHQAELTDEQKRKQKENMKKALPYACKWHKSEEGREWHSKHALKQWENKEPISYICDNCGKEFQSTNSYSAHENKFCSNACKSAFRRKLGVDNEERTCEYCGKTFVVGKYIKTKYCGRSCAAKARWVARKAI